mmetsp:Transcript_5400/g.15216  ORF Transcript_5400/g.15216 Transcript_5400/m.15216 type:complete len:390 (+) Transcript_5400:1314-2483(+)
MLRGPGGQLRQLTRAGEPRAVWPGVVPRGGGAEGLQPVPERHLRGPQHRWGHLAGGGVRELHQRLCVRHGGGDAGFLRQPDGERGPPPVRHRLARDASAVHPGVGRRGLPAVHPAHVDAEEAGQGHEAEEHPLVQKGRPPPQPGDAHREAPDDAHRLPPGRATVSRQAVLCELPKSGAGAAGARRCRVRQHAGPHRLRGRPPHAGHRRAAAADRFPHVGSGDLAAAQLRVHPLFRGALHVRRGEGAMGLAQVVARPGGIRETRRGHQAPGKLLARRQEAERGGQAVIPHGPRGGALHAEARGVPRGQVAGAHCQPLLQVAPNVRLLVLRRRPLVQLRPREGGAAGRGREGDGAPGLSGDVPRRPRRAAGEVWGREGQAAAVHGEDRGDV